MVYRYHLLRVLIAPSGFKESLGPEEVAECIQRGFRRIVDTSAAYIHKLPIHDGGEGFCRALVATHHGQLRHLEVSGPVGNPIKSYYGVIGNEEKVAVLDMAAAAGLRLVPKTSRDPTLTTTYGVGQLIAAALDEGCKKIIVGCGDSGTSDGGAGMLQALGARLFDQNGCEIARGGGGGSLASLDRICLDHIHPKLRRNGTGKAPTTRLLCDCVALSLQYTESEVRIEAVCNIENVLCGDRGVARVFGPQKGATQDQVETLSLALEKLANAIQVAIGVDISRQPGSGASGGLGAGLLFLAGKLRARNDAIDDYFQLERIFEQRWDIVVTAEGTLDSQSARGKMTAEVAHRAQAAGAKVVVLAGTIGPGAEAVYGEGISAFTSILDSPVTLEDAISQTSSLLTNAAERTMRMWQVGQSVNPPTVSVRNSVSTLLRNLGSFVFGLDRWMKHASKMKLEKGLVLHS